MSGEQESDFHDCPKSIIIDKLPFQISEVFCLQERRGRWETNIVYADSMRQAFREESE